MSVQRSSGEPGEPTERTLTRPRKVVITGISGRLGRVVARRLHHELDWQIVGLDRRPLKGRPKDIEHHQVDLRSKKARDVFRSSRIDALVHMGVMHTPRASAAETYSWNIRGTSKLFEYVLNYDVPKAIVLSSANVYGPRPENAQFLSEDAPLLAAQAFRMVVVPDLTRARAQGSLGEETRAYALTIVALAVPASTIAIVFAHPLGRRVRQLFEPVDESDAGTAGVGSVVLLPELLAKPRRDGNRAAESALDSLLARLELLPLDLAVAELATAIAARYRLRASDAVHLATAVHASADRFITNNQRDFPTTITEIEVVYPSMLTDPV